MYNMDFDPIEASQKSKDESMRIASMYAKCFSTKEGQLVLKDMISKFIMQSSHNPSDNILQVGIREGKAQLVKQILEQLHIAKEMNNG